MAHVPARTWRKLSASSLTPMASYRRPSFLFVLLLVLLLLLVVTAAASSGGAAAAEAAEASPSTETMNRDTVHDQNNSDTRSDAREDGRTTVTPATGLSPPPTPLEDNPMEGGNDKADGDDQPLLVEEEATPRDAPDAPLAVEEEEGEGAPADKALILAAVAAAPQRLPTYVETALQAVPLRRRDLGRFYYRTMVALLAHGNLSEVVLRAQEGAAVGHGRLHWLLGVLHMHGLGVEQSTAKGLLHYSMAAIDGVAEAHAALGMRYFWGDGVRRNCEVAVAHLKEAADAVAMTYDSRFQPRQPNTADFAVYSVDEHHKFSSPMEKLLVALERAPPGQRASLLAHIGDCYAKGRCQVAADWHTARDYYEQAVAAGDATVHGQLGHLYYLGDPSAVPPVAPDLEQAHRHFALAAEAGGRAGLVGMGFLHAMGYLWQDAVAPAFQQPPQPHAALHPDFVTARRYFTEAAGKNSPEGLYNLALLHLHGRGVPVDRPLAKTIFMEAATHGSLLAQWQLGTLFLREGDCATAGQLYQRVSAHGSWADIHPREPLSFMDDKARQRQRVRTQPAGQDGEAAAARAWGGSKALQREAASGAAAEGDPPLEDEAAAAREDARRLRDLLRYAEESPTPLVQLIEALQVAETGAEDMVGRTVELLQEVQLPADERHPADGRYAAHPTELPDTIPATLNSHTVYLQWHYETSERIRADYLRAHAATAAAATDVDTRGRASSTAGTEPLPPLPLPPRWLVSQREALELLRHDVLRRLARRARLEGRVEKGEPRDAAAKALGDYYYEGRSALLGVQLPLALDYYDISGLRSRDSDGLWYGLLHQLGIYRRAAELQQRIEAEDRHGGDQHQTDVSGGWLRQALERFMRRTGFQDDRVTMHALLDIVFATTPMNVTDYENAYKVYSRQDGRVPRQTRHLLLFALNVQWWYTHFTQRVVFGYARELQLSMPFFNATAYVAWEDPQALEALRDGGSPSSSAARRPRRTEAAWRALREERRAAARRTHAAQPTHAAQQEQPRKPAHAREEPGEAPLPEGLAQALRKEVMANVRAIYTKWVRGVSQLNSYGRVESVVLYSSLVALFALVLVRDHL